MKNRVLFVIYLDAIVTIAVAIPIRRWVIDDFGCITPDNGVGVCLPFNGCDSILKYFQSASPPTKVTKATVANYYCGVDGMLPKVCCPNHSKIVEAPPTKIDDSLIEGIDWDLFQKAIRSTDIGLCNIPDPPSTSSVCVPISECKAILDFIKKASPLSSDDIKLLHSYQCSNKNSKTVRVYCPESWEKIYRPPPDVTNHPNFKLLPEQCGPLSSDRIVNGNKTALLEYPWMALLSYEFLSTDGSTIDFACGGTIINNWYVLTAAHCIIDRPTRHLIGVRVGEYDIDRESDCIEKLGTKYCAPPVQDRKVAEVIPHPDFNFKSAQNDIGLIRLAQPINTDVDNVKPICLPTTQDMAGKTFENTSLTVSGWGVTETGRKSSDLLQANIPITPLDKCRRIYEGGSSIKINHKQICAGGSGDGGDSCSGDSGGPLKLLTFHNDDVRFVQMGVVSFGARICGQRERPGIYTRVGYYMDWILDNIKA